MTDDNMLLYFTEGKPVAMASFLPIRMHQGEEAWEGRYVYAVATLPEYRGRGYAAEILNTAKEIWQQPLLLSPAEDGLYTYYQKQGFFSQYAEEKWEIIPEIPDNNGEEWRFEEADISIYKEIRDLCFAGDGYVEWDEKGIAYALIYTRQTGGQALCVIHPSVENDEAPLCEDILLYETDEDTIKITETSLTKDALAQAAWLLLRKTGQKKALFQRPGGMVWLPEELSGKLIPGEGHFSLCLGD